MSDHYNPYEDESLYCVKPDEPQEPFDKRKGFNDVIDYFDIVNGYQIPKDIESLPKKYRKIFRYSVIAYLTLTFYELMTQLISTLANIIKEQI